MNNHIYIYMYTQVKVKGPDTFNFLCKYFGSVPSDGFCNSSSCLCSAPIDSSFCTQPPNVVRLEFGGCHFFFYWKHAPSIREFLYNSWGALETTRDHEVTEATMDTVAKEDQDPTAAAPEPLEKCEEPELSWFDSARAGDLRNLSLHATGSWVGYGLMLMSQISVFCAQGCARFGHLRSAERVCKF